MIPCPVNFPAEVHVTAIFALRNGKFWRWGEGGSPHTPVGFISVYSLFHVRNLSTLVLAIGNIALVDNLWGWTPGTPLLGHRGTMPPK